MQDNQFATTKIQFSFKFLPLLQHICNYVRNDFQTLEIFS